MLSFLALPPAEMTGLALPSQRVATPNVLGTGFLAFFTVPMRPAGHLVEGEALASPADPEVETPTVLPRQTEEGEEVETTAQSPPEPLAPVGQAPPRTAIPPRARATPLGAIAISAMPKTEARHAAALETVKTSQAMAPQLGVQSPSLPEIQPSSDALTPQDRMMQTKPENAKPSQGLDWRAPIIPLSSDSANAPASVTPGRPAGAFEAAAAPDQPEFTPAAAAAPKPAIPSPDLPMHVMRPDPVLHPGPARHTDVTQNTILSATTGFPVAMAGPPKSSEAATGLPSTAHHNNREEAPILPPPDRVATAGKQRALLRAHPHQTPPNNAVSNPPQKAIYPEGDTAETVTLAPRHQEPAHQAFPSYRHPLAIAAPPPTVAIGHVAIVPNKPQPPSMQPNLGPSQVAVCLPAAPVQIEPIFDSDAVAVIEASEPLRAQLEITAARTILGNTAVNGPPSPAMVQQILRVIQQGQTGVTEMLLQPEELGHLRISISSEGDQLSVTITAERGETLDLLRRHADRLLVDLRQEGFASLNLGFAMTGNGQAPRESTPEEMSEQDESLPLSPTNHLERLFSPKRQVALYLRI